MKDIYTEIELQFATLIDYLASAANAEATASLGELHAKMLRAFDAQMNLRYNTAGHPSSSISNTTVTVEVQDIDTNRIYRRSLPMEYEETNNGITLKGENLEGVSQSITFLSDTAVRKIIELTGHGPGNPHCDDPNK